MRTIRRFQPSCHPTNVNPHECGSTTTGNECATPSFDSPDVLDPPKRGEQRPEDRAEARAFRYRARRQQGPSPVGVRGAPVLARRATPCHPGDGGVETEVEPASRISFRVLIHRRARSHALGCSPNERPILSWTSPSLWCSPSLPWCEHLPSCTSAGFATRDAVSAGASGSY